MNFMQYYDEDAVRAALRAQIEHYFSKQNLVRDIFLRQRMDREGYIPCEMLFGFPRVRSMCFSIEFMLAAVADSDVLDVDTKNEKVRAKGSWKTWLFPSSDGTLGVPLYTKFPRQDGGAKMAVEEQRMLPVPASPRAGNSSADESSSTDDESASDSATSTPSTPTRSSARSTPSASPVPKASLSVDAAEWTPSF